MRFYHLLNIGSEDNLFILATKVMGGAYFSNGLKNV